MFKKARIRLTLTYVSIILLLTVSFSFAIYKRVMTASRVALREQQLRRPLFAPAIPPASGFDEETFRDISGGVIYSLIYINLGIAVLTTGIGYLLAGITLKPIEDMVNDQKRFVSDAAHELRTPLTSMKTELEVGLRNKNLNLKQARLLMRSSVEEIDKLKSLAENLLEESRLTGGNSVLVEKLDLAVSMKSAIKEVEVLAKKEGIEIKSELTKTFIISNRDHMERLFLIFLENAIKYSGKGKEVFVKVKSFNSKAYIEIQDFGIGIPEEDIPHIFKRFYRADSSRFKSDSDGFGLGLSIAYNIINEYKGNVKVESSLDKGTKFIITFPLAR